jgi:2-dehydro-3-deoxyphosphogluconate aldolase/(4S)-4-hydroxy-2-oxoglutarate aldolase
MLSEDEILNLNDIFRKNKIIPVAVFNDVSRALKTAELLLKNSIDIIEITLRTEMAIRCLREVGNTFPEMFLGCGSVLSREELDKAMDTNIKFAVSPCFNIDIIEYASLKNIQFVPGIATPSELNMALEAGVEIIKFFPAVALGGVDYLKSMLAPFKKRDFYIFPTGGINESNIMDFLKLPEVIACGASYIVDGKLLESDDYDELESRMKRTRELFR